MPKYTFKCDKCGESKQLVKSAICKAVGCECGGNMPRQMPKLCGATEVMEKEGMFNTAKRRDQDKVLRDRSRNFFWKHEVPKMVNSGIYTMETMLENGWVYYDEKGKLQTRTAPPESE